MTAELLRGLPENLEAERMVLGSILIDNGRYSEVAGMISAGDFAIQKHQLLFNRISEMKQRGDVVDHFTLANELLRRNELDLVDGLTYVASLSDGLIRLTSIDAYLKIVRDKSVYRKLVFSGHKLMQRALMAEDEHRVVIEETRSELMGIYDSVGSEFSAETAYEIVAEGGGVNEFFSSVSGIKSRWPKLDFFTGGWQKGDLIIMAARPSMGKTAFALNALWHAAAVNGHKCVFYSFEMHRKAIVRRLLSLITKIPFLEILQGHTTQSERGRLRAALDMIEQSGLRIVQASGKSVTALRAHAEKLKSKNLLDMAGIDYIGLMKGASGGRTNMSRTHELGEVARDIKRLGMDLEIPVMLLCQLNRSVEARPDKRPNLSDLRDSGEIEEHADLIGFIHRPGYYKRDEPALENVAEIIIGKQRNGDTPIVDLKFERSFGSFEEETGR